jgi:SEC-C motif-containing protein
LGPSTEQCCGPYIDQTKTPPTAEALMRSRYTAYALGKTQYIVDTHHPKTASDIDREALESWSKGSDWTGLEIKSTEQGQDRDNDGVVEFVAHYRSQDQDVAHHERSTFRKLGGKWFFWDGERLGNQPLRRDAPKIGRNDPCSCGSGKKYKKCCGRT